MKLAWLSDLHLECIAHSSSQVFVRYLAAEAFDALVITGDLSNAVNLGYPVAENAWSGRAGYRLNVESVETPKNAEGFG
jgi:3',5'-cyclic AMP phosphodiesterase CpdA